MQSQYKVLYSITPDCRMVSGRRLRPELRSAEAGTYRRKSHVPKYARLSSTWGNKMDGQAAATKIWLRSPIIFEYCSAIDTTANSQSTSIPVLDCFYIKKDICGGAAKFWWEWAHYHPF